jgi:hypothetical protein
MFWKEPDSSAGALSPMVKAENGKTGKGAEGDRLQVSPSFDVEHSSCSDVAKVIVRTLQQNGAYIGDTSGGPSGIKAEQGSTFPGLTPDVLSCVSWKDMRVVDPASLK